jgi:hypothetical protein
VRLADAIETKFHGLFGLQWAEDPKVVIIGISTKVLSEQFSELTSDGLVKRAGESCLSGKAA